MLKSVLRPSARYSWRRRASPGLSSIIKMFTGCSVMCGSRSCGGQSRGPATTSVGAAEASIRRGKPARVGGGGRGARWASESDSRLEFEAPLVAGMAHGAVVDAVEVGEQAGGQIDPMHATPGLAAPECADQFKLAAAEGAAAGYPESRAPL